MKIIKNYINNEKNLDLVKLNYYKNQISIELNQLRNAFPIYAFKKYIIDHVKNN